MPKILLLIVILASIPCQAAENWYINLPAEPGTAPQTPLFAPGVSIRLPDGRQGIIQEILPDGDLRTDLGVVISPQGIVRGDPQNGQAQLLERPEEAPGAAEQEVIDPKGEAAIVVEKPKIAVPAAQPKKPEDAPLAKTPENKAAPTPQAPNPEEKALTLAELLPLTSTEPKKQPSQEKPAQKPEAQKQQPKPEQQEQKPVKPKQEKQEQKPAKPKQEKPKAGQELRIPPEAAQTGNLDFLEGCWQGTRPEYFSKRTIRECFCFGANGQNGKRRVFDPLGHRSCIGASRASLSKAGVLSVTSQGAACDDGERWGQAEMVCRNSGPKTPCSWVFRDANNGRQSYSIPFVRVESCGR